MTAISRERPRSAVEPADRGHRRADIQGLRAIAVGLVLLHHAGVQFLPGGYVGVDVFFVISGFLITGLLLREAAASDRISLVRFYARRANRILPAATLVLVVVVILTVTILPRTRWEDTAWQVIGSATYVVNWMFAAASVEYGAADIATSPVQHYWTLAVEEQFYIVWPLLLVALVFASRAKSSRHSSSSPRAETRRRTLVAIGVLAVTLPSLAWSVYYTDASPDQAYFVTPTRLWELGIGAMVAVFATGLARLPNFVAGILGWAGLAAMVAAGVLYTPDTLFPGSAALLPTLGAAAVIVAGMNGRERSGAGRLLSVRPMTWVGDISYSLYLWHWPLLIIAVYLFDGLELYQGLLVAAVSFLPAYLSYRLVEQPVLRSRTLQARPGIGLGAGGGMMLVAVAAGVVLLLLIPRGTSPQAAPLPTTPASSPGVPAPDGPVFGAELLAIDPSVGIAVDEVGEFTPAAVDAREDRPPVYDGCHVGSGGTEVDRCVFGNEDGEFTMAIAGDSHAAQWIPALIRLAEENDWRLETYTKSSCPLVGVALEDDDDRFYEECAVWNDAMLELLTGSDHPDFVVLTSAQIVAYEGDADGYPTGSVADGFASSWTALEDAGVPFAVIQDTPNMEMEVPECVDDNEDQLTECAVPRDETGDTGAADQLLAATATGVSLIDLNASICPADPCAAVIGGVLVWRDADHLTATYVRTLGPALGARLREYPEIPFR